MQSSRCVNVFWMCFTAISSHFSWKLFKYVHIPHTHWASSWNRAETFLCNSSINPFLRKWLHWICDNLCKNVFMDDKHWHLLCSWLMNVVWWVHVRQGITDRMLLSFGNRFKLKESSRNTEIRPNFSIQCFNTACLNSSKKLWPN